MKEEIFKDIPGYEGLYQVSNLGNVKSLTRKVFNSNGEFIYSKNEILLSKFNSNGYYQVRLCLERIIKTITVHKLVAITFLNHTPDRYKIVVDHINGIRTDNRLENLQLITQRENVSKDKKNKTSKYTGVHLCKTKNKWISNIRINNKKKHIGSFYTEKEANEAYQNKLKEILNECK